MSICYKLVLAFSLVLVLAAGVALYAVHAISQAGDLVVRLYDKSFMATSHARAAQAKFNEARAAMERGFMLPDGRAANVAMLEAAMKDVFEELKIVAERMSHSQSARSDREGGGRGAGVVQGGLRILRPPAGGLVELPATSRLMSKADAVGEAIDLVVEEASAYGFEFRTTAESSVTASRRNLIGFAAGTGVVCLLLSFGIAYSFTRPLQGAMAFSERIASGDFSLEVKTKRNDEFGRLLTSLERMRAGAAPAKRDGAVRCGRQGARTRRPGGPPQAGGRADRQLPGGRGSDAADDDGAHEPHRANRCRRSQATPTSGRTGRRRRPRRRPATWRRWRRPRSRSAPACATSRSSWDARREVVEKAGEMARGATGAIAGLAEFGEVGSTMSSA